MFRLKARETGTDYAISITTSDISITLYVYAPGSNPVMRDFYKIGCMVFDNDDNLLGEDMLPLDANNEALFRMKEYVKPELISDFTGETDVNPVILLLKRENICKSFYIKYFEFYGDPPIHKKLFKSINRNCLNGSIDKYTRALFNEKNTNWFEQQQISKYFLTSQPRTKTVSFKQNERLFFLNTNPAVTRINMFATAYWTDLTATVDQFIGSVTISGNYVVVELICTPKLIRSKFAGSKILERFTVKLVNDSTGLVISERFSFTIDRNFYINNRFYIAQNSLGGFDTIRTRGDVSKMGAYTSQDISIFFDHHNAGIKDHENIKDRGVEIVKYKVDSGYFTTREEAEWYRELLLSEKVYEIIFNFTVPIKITSKKLVIFEDNNFGYHISFEYQRAYSNKYYSNLFLKYIIGGVYGDGYGPGYFTEEELIEFKTQNINQNL